MPKASGAVAPPRFEPDDIELPDANAANAAISEYMREEREQARGNRRPGAMQWVALIKAAEKDHPDNLFKQFAHCIRNGKVPAGTGRKREVGDSTERKFATDLLRAFNDLRGERMNIRNLSELKRKHVIRLIQRYIQRGKSPSTINGRITALRKLLTFAGRPREIPTGAAWKRVLRENGIDPALLRRSQIRVVPRAVSAHGLRPEDVIARVDEARFLVRLWLRLMWHFGLRPKECAELDPIESDRGDHLLVLHGAKANRKRTVHFSKDPERRAAQRVLLDEAKALVPVLGHPQWKLRDRHRNTLQALNHFYYVTRRSGITEKELEVVPYSFRHEFANAEYEEVATLPPPVLRKVPSAEYAARAEAVTAAKQHVVRQLGHSAEHKSNSYNGSVHELGRQERRQYAVMNMVSANAALGRAVEYAGIQEVWLIGRAAAGGKLGADEPIELAMRTPRALVPTAMLDLAQALKTLPRAVALTWCSERPDPGLEVIFPHQREPAAAARTGLMA